MRAAWQPWGARLGRSPVVPVVFAVGLLLVPLSLRPGRTAVEATWTTIELLAILGIGAGWFLTDRAVAVGVPVPCSCSASWSRSARGWSPCFCFRAASDAPSS